MDIALTAIVAAIILSFVERRALSQAFPAGPCRHCEQLIRFDRHVGWIHADGEVYAETYGIDYSFPDMPLHVAAPLS